MSPLTTAWGYWVPSNAATPRSWWGKYHVMARCETECHLFSDLLTRQEVTDGTLDDVIRNAGYALERVHRGGARQRRHELP